LFFLHLQKEKKSGLTDHFSFFKQLSGFYLYADQLVEIKFAKISLIEKIIASNVLIISFERML